MKPIKFEMSSHHLSLSLRNLAVLSLILFLGVGCGKDKEEAAPFTGDTTAAPSNVVSLEKAVSSAGCFDISNYSNQFHSLNGDLTLVEIPTKLDIDSRYRVRTNYERTLAYGILYSALGEGTKSVRSFYELKNLRQEECTTIIHTAADGKEEAYKIKQSSREHVQAQSEDGKILEYRWISPTSLQIRHRYSTLDVPCSSDKSTIFVDVTKVIDWSEPKIRTIDQSDSRFSIEDSLLKKAAEAVGYQVANLFEGGNPEGNTYSGVLSLNRLREMIQQRPRPEVLSCTGVVDTAPPVAPNPDPNAPGEPSPPGIVEDEEGGDSNSGETPPPTPTPETTPTPASDANPAPPAEGEATS